MCLHSLGLPDQVFATWGFHALIRATSEFEYPSWPLMRIHPTSTMSERLRPWRNTTRSTTWRDKHTGHRYVMYRDNLKWLWRVQPPYNLHSALVGSSTLSENYGMDKMNQGCTCSLKPFISSLLTVAQLSNSQFPALQRRPPSRHSLQWPCECCEGRSCNSWHRN